MLRRKMNGHVNGQVEKLFIEDSWRVFRIISEFVEGFEELSGVGDCVTMFGSARSKEGDQGNGGPTFARRESHVRQNDPRRLEIAHPWASAPPARRFLKAR